MTDKKPGELSDEQANKLGVDSASCYREFKNSRIEYTMYYRVGEIRRRVDFELAEAAFDGLDNKEAEELASSVAKLVIETDLEDARND
jgi:hypothetical protein